MCSSLLLAGRSIISIRRSICGWSHRQSPGRWRHRGGIPCLDTSVQVVKRHSQSFGNAPRQIPAVAGSCKIKYHGCSFVFCVVFSCLSARQAGFFHFFVLGAISNMTVIRIYKPYSNQVMVLFQGKLISGWFNANTINAIAITSIIKPRILDIRFFVQSTSLSNWELFISSFSVLGLAVHHTLHETSLSKIPYYQLHLPITSLLLPHRVIHTKLSAYN